MTMKIESSQNPLYKEWRKLHRKKYRNNNNLFLIEGVKMLGEALEWESTFEAVLYNQKLFDTTGGKDIYIKILERNIPLYELENVLVKELCQTETPQGVIGVLQQPINSIEKVMERKNSSIIILEEIQDPGNLGTIIRTADAAGFDAVILSKGCVDVYNDKVLRSTMGSVFHLPIFQDIELEEILPRLVNKEYQIIGTHLKAQSYYHEINYSESKALIIGNEAHGISRNTEERCTDLVKIPMRGNAESLNAAIAAGILMYKVQGL